MAPQSQSRTHTTRFCGLAVQAVVALALENPAR